MFMATTGSAWKQKNHEMMFGKQKLFRNDMIRVGLSHKDKLVQILKSTNNRVPELIKSLLLCDKK